MLKRVFTAALCGALFLQAPITVLADDERPEPITFDYGAEPEELPIEEEVSDAVGIKVDYHSVGKIKEYVAKNGPSYLTPGYTAQPDPVNAPYSAGALDSVTLSDALKTVNTVRYIAGLNNKVTLDSSYTEMVQAGALVNAVNGEISHKPAKPAGIDESLYTLGYSGNQKANLAMGYETLAKAITRGWLNDGDESNIDVIGHRRWLLNATMGKTGFGQVGEMTGMYAFDTSGSTGKTSNVWPAQNTPLEFFGSDYPWSVSTGYEENIDNVRVVMSKNNGQVSYVFSKNSSQGYFNVDNDSYGDKGAIIWRPDNFTYSDGDTYEVKITGLSNVKRIVYTVTFFKLYDEETMTLSRNSVEMSVGETAEVTASFAPGTNDDYVSSIGCAYSGAKSFTVDLSHNVIKINAIAEGSGTITVNSNNGLSSTINVTVKKSAVAVTGISVTPESATVTAGNTVQLNAEVTPANADDKTVTWSSSDTSVATVNNGLVTGIKAGTATITATTVNGLSDMCIVTVEKAPVQVVANSLNLKGKVGINYFLDIPSEDLKDLTIKLIMNNISNTSVSVPAADAEVRVVNGKECRLVSINTVAKELRDDIILTVVDKNGNKVRLVNNDNVDVTDGFVYSAKAYFDKALVSGSEKIKPLIKALDAYGKYAQLYFNYKTEQVSDLADVSAVTAETVSTYAAKMTGGVEGLTYSGATMQLQSDNGIRLHFTLADGKSINDCTFTIDGKTAAPVLRSGSTYYVSINNIAAKDLNVEHTITASIGSETLQLRYSAMSYVYTALSSDTVKPELKNLCRALYIYNQAAITYFAN